MFILNLTIVSSDFVPKILILGKICPETSKCFVSNKTQCTRRFKGTDSEFDNFFLKFCLQNLFLGRILSQNAKVLCFKSNSAPRGVPYVEPYLFHATHYFIPLLLSWDWSTLYLMKCVYLLCMYCACFYFCLECPRKWWFLIIFGARLFNFRLNAEYQGIVDSRDILAIYVEEKSPDYEIRRIPGDGLCVVRSFKVCMEAATG